MVRLLSLNIVQKNEFPQLAEFSATLDQRFVISLLIALCTFFRCAPPLFSHYGSFGIHRFLFYYPFLDLSLTLPVLPCSWLQFSKMANLFAQTATKVCS